jgi:hypothetical protein
MAWLGAAERVYLSREIGVERRQLDSGIGFCDGKRATFFHAEARNDILRKEYAKAISDPTDFGLHEGIIT